jgi:hypothetical protein
VFDRMMEAGQRGKPAQWRISGLFGRRLVLKLASAAAVVIFAGAGVCWMIWGGVSSATADYSEMLRRVSQAATVSYDETLQVPGQPDMKVQVQMAGPSRMRVTKPDGKVSVSDIVRGECLSLTPSEKKAVFISFPAGEAQDDPLEDLQRAGAAAGRLVGNETVNGVKATLYEVTGGVCAMRIWVDPQRELPIRIEVSTRDTSRQQAMAILENFEWDKPLADSLFALDAPAGYAIQRPQADCTEASLLGLLRVCAQLNQGAFPADLDPHNIMDLVLGEGRDPQTYRLYTGDTPTVIHTGGDDTQKKEDYKTCLAGLAFVAKAGENQGWQYAGKGVKLGDADAVVCWWKPTGTTLFRAVYGDLQIKDVAEESLPGGGKPAAATNPVNESEPGE